MANIKTGFIFYKVDTDRFQDIRIKRLKKDRGCKGYAVYEYFLNEIYRVKGCFLAYDESAAFDAAEYWGLEESQVNDIVHYCCACGLFDKGLFTSAGILTSRSIQSRYIEMSRIAKRKDYGIPENYNLLCKKHIDSSGVNADSSGINNDYSGIMCDSSGSLPQSKVKKSKYNLPIVPPSGDGAGDSIQRPDLEKQFEAFRVAYGGTKRGFQVEFAAFRKKYRDWQEVVPLLMPALEKLIRWRERCMQSKSFCPQWAHLSTWLNQRRWEDEFPEPEDGSVHEGRLGAIQFPR